MDVLKKIAKCYKDIKTVFLTKLKIAVGAIEEVATAINNFVVGEIDEVVNGYEQKDSNVKEQLMNKMRTGLDVHVESYYSRAFQLSEIMFAPKAQVISENLSYCFDNCTNLLYVDEMYSGDSDYALDYVTNIAHIFYNDSKLEGIPDSIKFRNVTNASGAFYGCKSLREINCEWNSLVSSSSMFAGCSNLIKVTGLTKLSNSVDRMFFNCVSLTDDSVDFANINVDGVNLFDSMFSGCSGLTTLDLRGWNTTNATSFVSMFYATQKLKRLDVSSFDFSNSKSFTNMFRQTFALGSDNGKFVLGNGITGGVASWSYAFAGMSRDNNVDAITEIIGVDFSSVENITNSEGVVANSSSTTNSICSMIYSSKITRCIFAGNHNVKFDCIFNTYSWQNLDAESIESFIKNCLYDFSIEADGSHYMQVTSAMSDALWTDEIEPNLTYAEYMIGIGWDLQY